MILGQSGNLLSISIPLTYFRWWFTQDDCFTRQAHDGLAIAAVIRAVGIILPNAVFLWIFTKFPVTIQKRLTLLGTTLVLADATAPHFVLVDNHRIVSAAFTMAFGQRKRSISAMLQLSFLSFSEI